jgi:DNA polymerase-3 subunit epsilon
MEDRKIVLDTETTGLDPSKGHRLVEIGCLEIINRRLTGKRFHTYLNPERELDSGAENVHGLSLEFLKDKPTFVSVVDEFLNFIRDAELIIHNAPFDLGFLNTELKLLSHPYGDLEQSHAIYDTLLVARRLHPGQKNNLDALCKRYAVDNSNREYHGALLDAELLAKVYLQMTAGQTSLSFSDSEPLEKTSQIKKRKPKMKRFKNVILKVIRASDEELSLHEKRMAELNQ